ncbi:PAS domain-containing sensor histidine kinase [Peribacillus frigoritolerans]|uniref:PAS domain-containing sensor histidine kinase n=1 Tax=Peribacillus frigoritolerans TaxID=450367 RepID=UPI00207AAD8A|nr:PAS domain-containing sensor histidine kinase [Peribacillus frigoritolerans]USK76323.1 PAS domain S-box protein [Peribacillus frigoritolerans]
MNIGYENETEYKREILKLNKQIEGFLNIFDSMSEPYIRVDEELRLTYANDAACDLLETPKDQLESMRITDFLDVIPLNNQEVSSTLKTSNESERQVIQLHTGALKQIEFIRMGSLSEGQQFYRLGDVTLDVSSSRETGMSRQMFLDIFDTAIESIVLFDSSGIIMEVNHAFIHALGIPKKEIVGKNMRDLISPDYRGYWDESIQRAFDESNYKGEVEIKVGDELHHFTFSISSAVGNELFMSVLQRITESNIIEKKLETSERIFAELFDQSMDAIIFWNDDGIIFRVNHSACKIFESSREDLIGSYIWKYVYSNNHHFGQMMETFERDTQVRGELIYKMPNNQIKLLELTAKKHEGDGYNVTIFRNVSERWLIEKELRDSEKKFRKIFEGTLDGLILWNHEGFTDINEAGQKILEISKRKLLSLSVKGFIEKIPENAPVLNAHIENVYKHEVYSSIIPITFEDGRVKHIEFLTRKNLYSNLNLSIFRDVSKNLEMQEQIRKSDTLNVVGELAAGIAHEIRNPMTALKGFIQLLEDGVKGEFSTYFHVITSEIKRIETIITEFLVLAKPQALKIFKQDVHTILRETLELLAAQALLENIQFETNFEEDECKVLCEANQLKQVFINIIKNALEVMPDGGSVHIKTSQFSEKYVCISITDKGMGISTEMLKKLGEPFYTTKDRGTGLGLMVSYKIIEEHNGYIEVESEVGKGTSFHIYLPFE